MFKTKGVSFSIKCKEMIELSAAEFPGDRCVHKLTEQLVVFDSGRKEGKGKRKEVASYGQRAKNVRMGQQK